MVKIKKVGIAMVFFYSMLMIPVLVAMCICTCSKNEERIGKTFEGQFQIVGILSRLIFLIMSPILGIAIFASKRRNESG